MIFLNFVSVKMLLKTPKISIGIIVAMPKISIIFIAPKMLSLIAAFIAKKYTIPQGIAPFNNPKKYTLKTLLRFMKNPNAFLNKLKFPIFGSKKNKILGLQKYPTPNKIIKNPTIIKIPPRAESLIENFAPKYAHATPIAQ